MSAESKRAHGSWKGSIQLHTTLTASDLNPISILPIPSSRQPFISSTPTVKWDWFFPGMHQIRIRHCIKTIPRLRSRLALVGISRFVSRSSQNSSGAGQWSRGQAPLSVVCWLSRSPTLPTAASSQLDVFSLSTYHIPADGVRTNDNWRRTQVGRSKHPSNTGFLHWR